MDKVYDITIQGTRPILMHNGQLADPMNAYTKALKVCTSKKARSDEENVDVMRAEYQGGLYHDDGPLGPFIPADNLTAMIELGAAKQKLRPKFKAGVMVMEPEIGAGYKLDYKGPRDRKGLWADEAFQLRKGVRVNGSRVIRTRPRFPTGWSVSFRIEVLNGIVSAAQLEKALEDAGELIGLGDWKPRYGRFTVVSFKS